MKRFAVLLLLLVTTAAFAQAPTRVRGTITGVSGDAVMVKTRDGRNISLQLTPDAQVVTPKLTTLAEFKPGSFVGVTSVKNAYGRLVAQRVHALGPQVPGTRADLKPGETIFAGARAEGDKLVAPRIAVSKDGVHPPQ